jgi:hypothetical protein
MTTTDLMIKNSQEATKKVDKSVHLSLQKLTLQVLATTCWGIY